MGSAEPFFYVHTLSESVRKVGCICKEHLLWSIPCWKRKISICKYLVISLLRWPTFSRILNVFHDTTEWHSRYDWMYFMIWLNDAPLRSDPLIAPFCPKWLLFFLSAVMFWYQRLYCLFYCHPESPLHFVWNHPVMRL